MSNKPEKKIKDTALGIWLREKVPSVLDVAGDLLPDAGVLGMIKNLVNKDPNVSPADKIAFEEMKLKKEIEAQKAVTDRWRADMSGDVKLAKYIRPFTLIVLSVFFMSVMIWDGLDQSFMPPQNYVNLLELLLLTVFGAYFAGRTIEKTRRK